jgi:hypothetical protein
VNDLYKEKYKPLKKETEEDYRRWKDLLCSWPPVKASLVTTDNVNGRSLCERERSHEEAGNQRERGRKVKPYSFVITFSEE